MHGSVSKHTEVFAFESRLSNADVLCISRKKSAERAKKLNKTKTASCSENSKQSSILFYIVFILVLVPNFTWNGGSATFLLLSF